MIELLDNYRVYLVKLPATVRGAVRIDNDGFASIYINEQLSPQAKKATFLHEIRHLQNDDMYNDKSIYEVEGLCQGQKNSI
jgi:Zn-dependent peptidase ImmA (M78 family)